MSWRRWSRSSSTRRRVGGPKAQTQAHRHAQCDQKTVTLWPYRVGGSRSGSTCLDPSSTLPHGLRSIGGTWLTVLLLGRSCLIDHRHECNSTGEWRRPHDPDWRGESYCRRLRPLVFIFCSSSRVDARVLTFWLSILRGRAPVSTAAST
jgi:hypothetical protein